MKYGETISGVLVLALRLAFVPPGRWALDWIAALAVLWIALALTREGSKSRHWSVGLGCVWLAAIYAAHQAAWTFAGFS
jgi:uncharacterized membrane protein